MKKILVLVLLFSFISPVFATNWVRLAEKIYLDGDSLSQDKYGNINFWVKQLRIKPTEKYKNKDFWYKISYITINCSERKTSLNATTIYDLNGDIIDSFNWKYLDWQAIVPGSYGDFYYEIICKKNFDVLE